MKKVLIRSGTIGLVLGSVFFALAPLGLGLSFVEALGPVLIPGVYLVQFFGLNTIGPIPLLLAFVLNVLLYSLLTMTILLTNAHFSKEK